MIKMAIDALYGRSIQGIILRYHAGRERDRNSYRKTVDSMSFDTCRVALIGFAMLASLGAGSAQAATALENAIARANPCEGNKTTVAGTTLGIDKFDRVEIREFSVSGKGNVGQAFVSGFLSCKTSDKALFPGDANAEFIARATIDLTTCAITSKQVDIPKTGGKYKLIVDLLKSRIISGLEGSIVSEAKKICK